ncbi:MAG: GHKL domain-containing protein [Bacteroidales bacterium]|nr:GHKL domain-containing protein [Clostridium sp.]MCM1203488.1 GHKL domain-containing protein [Bacteroidales bacterium]
MRDIFLTVIIAIINSFVVLNSLLVLKTLFGADMRVTKRTLFVVAAVFCFFDTVMSLWLGNGEENLLFGLRCLFLAGSVLVLTKSRRIKTLLLAVPAIFVYLQGASFFTLFGRVAGLHRYTVTLLEEEIGIVSIASDIAVFAILLYLLKIQKRRVVQLTLGEGIFLLCFCIFSPAITGVFTTLQEEYPNIAAIWIIFMIFINMAVIYGIIHRKRSRYYKNLAENYREQFNKEYTHFKDYRKAQKDMAKLRHDWNSHVAALQTIFRQGGYDEARAYFEKLPAVGAGVYKILTGNEMLDIVLSGKQEILDREGITFTCHGGLENLTFLEPVDACILFSNLIDNAVEACLLCRGERKIELLVAESPHLYMITIKNTMEKEPVWKDGMPVTGKKGKGEHGIGLANVADIMEKCGGECRVKTEGNYFIAQLVFKC